jgi:aarF domain-containing kinase
VAALVQEVHSSGLSLGRIGVAALLQKLLVACYRHQVKLESKFVSTILAIGVVEGLGRRLDPDVDVLQKAAPYIVRASLSSLSSNT